jgi:AbrB family looped-hinge helix DNA binding protein
MVEKVDTAKVSSKFQVVIPKKARDALGIKAGDKLIFDYRGDGVVALMARPADFVEFMRGLGSEVWTDVAVDEYLQGERET